MPAQGPCVELPRPSRSHPRRGSAYAKLVAQMSPPRGWPHPQRQRCCRCWRPRLSCRLLAAVLVLLRISVCKASCSAAAASGSASSSASTLLSVLAVWLRCRLQRFGVGHEDLCHRATVRARIPRRTWIHSRWGQAIPPLRRARKPTQPSGLLLEIPGVAWMLAPLPGEAPGFEDRFR